MKFSNSGNQYYDKDYCSDTFFNTIHDIRVWLPAFLLIIYKLLDAEITNERQGRRKTA